MIFKVGFIRDFLAFTMAFFLSSAFAIGQISKSDLNIPVPLSSSVKVINLESKGCNRVFFRELIVSNNLGSSFLQYFCSIDAVVDSKEIYVDLNSEKKIEPLYDRNILDGKEVGRILAGKGMVRVFPYEVARHNDENPVVYVGGWAISIGVSPLAAQCGCLCKNLYYTLQLRTIDGEIISRKLLLGLRSESKLIESSGYCRPDSPITTSEEQKYLSSLIYASPEFWVTVDGRILIAGLTNDGLLSTLFVVPGTLHDSRSVFGGAVALIDADTYDQFMASSINEYIKINSSVAEDAGKRAYERAEAGLKKAILSGDFNNKSERFNEHEAIVRCPSSGDSKVAAGINRQGENAYSKNLDEALALFEKSIEADGSFARAYNNLAVANYKKNNLEQSQRFSNFAVACGWRDSKLLASALFNLGKVFEARNNREKAKYLYEQAYWNNPLQVYIDASARVRNVNFK